MSYDKYNYPVHFINDILKSNTFTSVTGVLKIITFNFNMLFNEITIVLYLYLH